MGKKALFAAALAAGAAAVVSNAVLNDTCLLYTSTGIAQTHRIYRVCAVSAQLIQRNAVKTAKAHQVKDGG